MASRVVGWGASPNFETMLPAFGANGRTPDCLSRVKRWLSLGDRVPPAVKSVLTAVDTDYALEGDEATGRSFIRPGHLHAPRVADPLDQTSCKWELPSLYGHGRLGVRLRALSAVPLAGNRTDLLSLRPGAGATARNTACMAPGLNYSVVSDAPAGGPGALALRLAMRGSTTAQTTQCVRSEFAAPLDLSKRRVLEFTVHGDGSGAVLDIQLQDASAFVREFFITLSWTGWRTIRATLPAARGLYTHAGGQIPWASHPGNTESFNNKRAMRAFNWSTLLAFNIELTNTNQTVAFIGKIEALARTWVPTTQPLYGEPAVLPRQPCGCARAL